MTPVIIESPYAGDTAQNLEYARRAMLDSLNRGEAPFGSHLLYPQCLDDMKPRERGLGIEAGYAWYRFAHKCVVYKDYGLSGGMRAGMAKAASFGLPIEYRKIGENL